MKSSAELHAAEEFLRTRIPLTRAMEVRVVPAGDAFAITAPVAPNQNHLHTAFGGSINAVATLAGYTFLWFLLRDDNAELVVRESSIRFLRPIRETIHAVCEPVSDEEVTAFTKKLSSGGKAQITLGVRVEEAGALAARFEGTFMAMRKAVPQ